MGCSLSAPATGGFSVDSPCANVCGRLRGGEAGRQPTSWGYYSTPVRILQGGVAEALPWTDGLVLTCALLQRRVWLGLRRCPTRSALRRFPGQGDSPCTPGGNQGFPAPSFERQVRPSLSIAGDSLYSPAGAAPPAPCLGERGSERGRSQFLIGERAGLASLRRMV